MQPRQHHQSFRKNSSSKGFKMSRTWLRLFNTEQNDKLTGCSIYGPKGRVSQLQTLWTYYNYGARNYLSTFEFLIT